MNGFFTHLAHDIETGTLGTSRHQYSRYGVNITRTDIVHDIDDYRHGTYHSIALSSHDMDSFTSALSEVMREYLTDIRRVLIVGLGNAEYVCDRLGHDTIHDIDVRRYNGRVATLTPLVEHVTGMSSTAIIQGVVHEYKPSHIIIIDSVATSHVERLGTMVQITDSGICPGGGVGGDNGIIDSDTIGVPVIAIGVPMVISARALLGRDASIRYFIPSTIDDIVRRSAVLLSHAISRTLSDIF